MKLNKIILISILLLFALSLGVVCAEDSDVDMENLDNVQSDESENMLDEIGTVNTDDEKLTASTEEIVGDVNSDNVDVDVSNVFKGQNTTISVTVPAANGTVTVTVGEKIYTSELIGGVAKQTISEYNIGINNVTVKYNDIVKETSFKGFDGVITNETFEDYFEIVNNYYVLRSFIPESVTLDFRGYINRNYETTGVNGIYVTKPINITSTTGADLKMRLFIQNDAFNSNISNIKISEVYIRADNCNVINLTSTLVDNSGKDFKIVDSSILQLNMDEFNNIDIINCTIDNQFSSSAYYANNMSIINSTFNNGLSFSCKFYGYCGITDITIKNSIINGSLTLNRVERGLIENCTADYMSLNIKNMIIKDNFINASSSTYAIGLSGSGCKYNNIIGNRLYSKYYFGDKAIAYQNIYDIYFYPETMNVFKDNTPTQIDLDISFTSDTIYYDENTTVVVNMPGIKGNVVFYYNGEKLSVVELVNGIATQTIDKYNLGINNITVVYGDLMEDIYAINHTSFKVNKVDYCPINLVYEKVIEGETSSVNIILPDDAKGNITFVLSNNTHSITIKQYANGNNNRINLPSLFEGNYTMSATFTSIKYVTNSTSGILCSVHVPVYRLTASDIVMDYKDGSKYKVFVTIDGNCVGAGEIVNITFNGVSRSVKTDKDGYATLILDGAPKTYAIKAEYNGITKSTKVTIKNILKASNISKKKAKQIKFSATLKTSKGKAIIGKKITFKLKGKTYSAKTNKKGVATITLKNLKVGKYTITSKYGACVVKNTIKIRK